MPPRTQTDKVKMMMAVVVEDVTHRMIMTAVQILTQIEIISPMVSAVMVLRTQIKIVVVVII